MDKIGLVTVTYNSADVLQPFLNCIFKQSYQNFVLYIIDNDSKDDTISTLLNTNKDRIHLIRNNQNKGVAVANNQGIKLALDHNCDQVLIINNDVVFGSSLIDDLVKAQISCNSSLITPKIFFYDNPQRIWYAGSWFSKFKGYLPTHRGFEEIDNGKYNDTIEVNYAPTCCLLIKKQVFLDVGFMDEKYFVYFDDTDFLYRVWQKDEHKLYYFPSAKLYHKVGSLTNPNDRNKRKFK
ncbi:MAG: glycosyltransferase family 2 protein, partial [Flavobacteriales bacterium]|nr:glycosyltransferase family 2 protein [Flavobacteriales bacterium]